jgi:ABC-2 type transport system ATP-binding protein
VEGLDLEVRRGEIFGLLGPNGAGKTTTLRMLTGVLRPSSGEGIVLGRDVSREPDAVKGSLAYVPQGDVLYGDLRVRENLEFLMGVYGVPRAARADSARHALAQLRLEALRDRPTRFLSGGERRLLALAGALALRQSLVVLDEPTAGLDPENRVLVWDTLHELRQAGVTILVTTHSMDEADRCLRVGLMGRGRLLAQGTPESLRREITTPMYEVATSAPGADVARAVGAPRASARGARLRLACDAASEAEVSRRLLQAGIQGEVRGVEADMEDVFLALAAAPPGAR